MTAAEYTVRPLDATTWPDFEQLVDANGGIFGGCWCLGFHPEGAERGVPVSDKRERKRQRVLDGDAHAALVFDDGRCIGWCQFGRPDEVPRIKNRAAYERSGGGAPDWRIACCYVGAGHRRARVFTTALAGALDLIAAAGGGVVEGYPEPAGDVAAGFLYHGALATYEALGFRRDRRIGKHRWVVVTEVAPHDRSDR